MKLVYPGSFDPITNGHMDIIRRAAVLADELVVAVLRNSEKRKPLFSVEERAELIRRSVAGIENVVVDTFDGLLVDYARGQKAQAIVRGLRAMSDFESELQMASMNHRLAPDIEMLFLMTGGEYSFLSSSMVKELGSYDADISGLVPDVIVDTVRNRLHRGTRV
ncbi:MAG: pantetheine-phosphate adenylyltransferase [Christensenellales bacterium]|jgi:pantetheine-phosphate adenylyltransferase